MLSATFVMPAVKAEDEEPTVSPYEVLYDLNYENKAGTTDCWEYAGKGLEGSVEFYNEDGFSGSTSIKLGTNGGGYGAFLPYRGWDGNSQEIELTKGNTYTISYKEKKIPTGKSVSFNAIKDTDWIWGYGAKFKPVDYGWRSVSHTFTVGDAFTSDGKTLSRVPIFYYISSDVKNGDILLIDDFRLVQINDTSLLDSADPTSEIENISENEVLVKFTQEMSSDVTNPKAYAINGEAPQSVTYDAATKTAAIVPQESIVYGSDVIIAVSACDYLGRAFYNETTQKYTTLPQMTATTLPEDGKEESVGRNTYTLTFDKDIASAAVTVNGTAVSESAVKISDDKKTVSFEKLFDSAGEQAVSVTVTDTDGCTLTVERTFTVRDTWVAFTDFENRYGQEPFASMIWGFMTAYNMSTDIIELTGEQVHSGAYALHTKAEVQANVSLITGANGGWAYSKAGRNFAGLEVGKTYKYSYWVYADEAATKVTPSVLVRNAPGSQDQYSWKISSNGYSTLPKQQWNYFETTFTAQATDLPIFYNIPANLYIDDIRIDIIPTAEEVSTTLPAEGTNAELGYNEYSMTFDKDIASAQVTYNGKTTDAVVGTDAKTITFGLALIKDGNVTIVVTDTKGITATVTKAITVPDTLVAYTGFDKGSWMQDYLWSNIWNGPFVTEGYRSPGSAAKLVTTDPYGYSVGLCEWETSRVDYGPKTTAKGTGTDMTRHIESGKWYKVSFYAKAAVAGEKPTLGVARRKTDGQGEGVDMFEMTDELTKYESTFKAISDKLPFFYREEMNYEIILDDVLIEQIESPYDYTYDLSAKSVKKGASVTATLSNEKLATPMNGIAAIALYKDGILKECHITNVTNLALGSAVTTTAVTVPDDIDDGEYTVKAFLWDKDTMIPITDVTDIN